MACANPRCDRTCEEGFIFCCGPCKVDDDGSGKTKVHRRMRGVFHTHACEERENARQRRAAVLSTQETSG
jgi:hypothetical protein